MRGMEAVRRYTEAASSRSDEALGALAPHVADDAEIVGPFSAGSDRESVLAALSAPRAAILAQATWTEPEIEEGVVTVLATLPAGMRLAGIASTIWLDHEGRITRIIQEMIAAPAPSPSALRLTEDIKAAVDGAMPNGTPVVVAYVDRDGGPHVSLRGSVQAYGDTQLAMWIRDPEGGLVRALPDNPKLALFYRDPSKGITYQFAGRGRVDTDPVVMERVYAHTVPIERNMDPFRRGRAVIVELDRVEGMGPGGRFRMER
jgi:Pyridoxamine 5'-phosphate oxidase